MASSGMGVCSSGDWLCGGEGRDCWGGRGPMEGGGRPTGREGRMAGTWWGWGAGGRGGPPVEKRGGGNIPGGGGAHTGWGGKRVRWPLMAIRDYMVLKIWKDKGLLTRHHGRGPRSPGWVEIWRWWSIRGSTRKGAIHGAHQGSRRWCTPHSRITFRGSPSIRSKLLSQKQKGKCHRGWITDTHTHTHASHTQPSLTSLCSCSPGPRLFSLYEPSALKSNNDKYKNERKWTISSSFLFLTGYLQSKIARQYWRKHTGGMMSSYGPTYHSDSPAMSTGWGGPGGRPLRWRGGKWPRAPGGGRGLLYIGPPGSGNI